MENTTLRLRLVSFKKSTKSSSSQVLCYVKKLTNLPSSNGSSVILEATDPDAAFVRSIGETFNWHLDEGNYCQLIFLTSKSKSKIIGDIVLWFNRLLELVNDQRHQKESHTELLCSSAIEPNYKLEFSVQLLENAVALTSNPSSILTHSLDHKLSGRQPIRGHLMKIQQFNHPVYCAVCHGFIWGLHHQGFECSQCSLVTHRKCHLQIPFWCRKSLFPEPSSLNGGFRLKFHIPHAFKQHEAPFVRALVTRSHGHCSHCGSSIFRNALKCTQCPFIIHEHCQSNVPPMCTIPYNSMAQAITEAPNLVPIGTRFHKPKVPIDPNKSRTTTFSFSWLEPLPAFDTDNNASMRLPKFEDFEYVGRVGDGAFAQVYCVQHISSGQYMAIKVADGDKEQARQQLEVERQILFRYSRGNPYMVKAYCAFHQGHKLFLVMELVQGGSLYHKIQTTRMNEDEIRFFLAELICILQYLHSHKIVYRDLKLEHAVVCTEGHIRLVDYGLGRLLKAADENCHTFCGTYTYMAPEVRRLETGPSDDGYSYPVDFWALGIMFVQMLFGEPLELSPQMFPQTDEEISERNNLAELLDLPRHTSAEARSCIHGLLENNPKLRLGSPDSPHGAIRDHPFFKTGRRIEWRDVEDGLFKSFMKNQPIAPILSDISIHRPLSTLFMDRGSHGQADWLAAGRSTCTSAEDERSKSFDYIDQSAWRELIQTDV